MDYIFGILGIILGSVITYLICRLLPKIKIRELEKIAAQEQQELVEVLSKKLTNIKEELHEVNAQREERIQHLETLNGQLEILNNQKEENMKNLETIYDQLNSLSSQCLETRDELIKLTTERNTLQENLVLMQGQAKQSAESYYESQMELVQNRLDTALEQVATKYQEDEEAYKQEYLQIVQDTAMEYLKLQQEKEEEIAETNKILSNLKATVDAATNAARQEEEKKQSANFYRLILTQENIEDIQKLRSIEPLLKDKESLNKIIWKEYYEKPCTDLIGRVVGSKIKTGIYKITNLENQMCYVGQSVNIAERWKQHIKRGIGAEPLTRNKLYPAMLTSGVENFTFEIIEECSKQELDQKEKYWQNYFNALTFGYCMR